MQGVCKLLSTHYESNFILHLKMGCAPSFYHNIICCSQQRAVALYCISSFSLLSGSHVGEQRTEAHSGHLQGLAAS